MPDVSNQKIKFLNIIDILKKYTDDDHPLTADEICNELSKRNISSERKAIYRDIESLLLYGFDINKIIKPKRGFYLASRDFELPEIKLLIDAVESAPFITNKKTIELTEKLKNMISKYQALEIYCNTKIEKSLNEEIYYTIDAFNKAIVKNRKVRFIYHKRIIYNEKFSLDEGKICIISPYNIVWENNKYYVLGIDNKTEKVKKYKVDLIKKATILRENRNNIDFDYYSEEINKMAIEFICSYDIIEEVFERFGSKILVKQISNNKFYTKLDTYINEELIRWFIQYGELTYVRSPEKLVRAIESKLKKMNKAYKINDHQ